MPTLPNELNNRRRVADIFEELRAAGKPEVEIFAEAAENLKHLARREFAGLNAADSLRTTGLINDVFIKLFGRPTSEFRWDTGNKFFLDIVGAMHDLKVDYIRRKFAAKRDASKVESLDERTEKLGDAAVPGVFDESAMYALSIDKALRRLGEEFPDREKIIMLKYWGRENDGDGLTNQEIAMVLEISIDQVKLKLKQARARLQYFLSLPSPTHPDSEA